MLGPIVAVALALATAATLAAAQSQLTTLCEWTSAGGPDPAHRNVLGSVIVGDTPHNSTAGAVEIIFVSYNYIDGGSQAAAGSSAAYYGLVRIVDGRTCELHETFGGNAAQRDDQIIASSSPVLADLDNDGIVEILTLRAVTGIIAWKWNPANTRYEKWWSSTSGSAFNPRNRWDSLAVHDLDDDGFPEVINAGEVHNGRTGARINAGQSIRGSSNTFPVIANLDDDPAIEWAATRSVYEWNTATNQWDEEYSNVMPSSPGMAGMAVADFGRLNGPGNFTVGDFDGIAELVYAASGVQGVYALDGTEVFTITDGTGGGPPIVGDFDLDLKPEFARASRNKLTVYDPDCAVGTETGCLSQWKSWEQPSQDFSSSITGAAIFQFQGGEAVNAVYADECFVRVYDGPTGEVRFSAFRTSCTWCEQPVMANTDGVKGTEIIIGSNDNCGSPAGTGVACNSNGGIDPIHPGDICRFNGDCVRGTTCDNGLCRCTGDAQCDPNSRCVAPIAGTAGTGNVCRAFHPSGVGLTGIRVLTSLPNAPFLDSRTIWNQHTFTMTNIDENGRVPRTSEWIQNFNNTLAEGYNNFRANGQVCSGVNECVYGTCVGPNECVCDPGYFGDVCDRFTCFANNTPPGCVNFGFCVAADLCDCQISPPGPKDESCAPVAGCAPSYPTCEALEAFESYLSNKPESACGIVDVGCNSALDCGTCSDPFGLNVQCNNATNLCECVPQTCATLGLECNPATVDDQCRGLILPDSCGICGSGETCSAGGKCVPSTCTPTTSCSAENRVCGYLALGPPPCPQNVSCGTCDAVAGGQCDAATGTCSCVPHSPTCPPGLQCGSFDTGCGLIECGSPCAPGLHCNFDLTNRTSTCGPAIPNFPPVTTGTTATTGTTGSTGSTGGVAPPPSAPTGGSGATGSPTGGSGSNPNATGGATTGDITTSSVVDAAPGASVPALLLSVVATVALLLLWQ